MTRKTRFDAVCFDFDSTLSSLEGIDELAARAGVKDQIEPLTTAAMAGEIPIDSIYEKRLDIIRPNRAAIAWLAERYLSEIVSGARETLVALQQSNAPIYIISGGIRPAILPFAHAFGITPERVFAVDIRFDDNGNYQDFDRASPLATADGKAVICREIGRNHGFVAMIGDGVTDVSARAAGAHVIGFGGVVARDYVRAHADDFVVGPDLTEVLPLLFV